MAFLGSPVCVTARLLSPSPRVCTDGVRSYGDVIPKFSRLDGFTKISKEWGSARAPSARGSSTIKLTTKIDRKLNLFATYSNLHKVTYV